MLRISFFWLLAIAINASLGCKDSKPALGNANDSEAAPPSLFDSDSGHATIAPLPSNEVDSAAPSATLERTRTLHAPEAPTSLGSLGSLGLDSEPPSNDRGPAVVFAPPRVTGGLLTDFDPALRRMRAAVRACYVRFLAEEEEPPQASALTLRVVVMENGSVQSVKGVGAEHLSASAVDCMVRRAQVATFPTPVGEPAEVFLPITLHP
jgi:hypothetical protein